VRISFLIWRSRPLQIPSHWRTGHCPVPPSDRWLDHVSRADRAADRWPGRPLAHRTVRCTPDSPVNYSRTPLITSREQLVRLSQPGAPDTVRCTTGHCPVRISFLIWRSRPLQSWSRWRTGHCPVPPSDHWLGHVSRVDRAADRWPGRPLAHRTVR
jgi:hypothetical protein